jgi:hypothetical protein
MVSRVASFSNGLETTVPFFDIDVGIVIGTVIGIVFVDLTEDNSLMVEDERVNHAAPSFFEEALSLRCPVRGCLFSRDTDPFAVLLVSVKLVFLSSCREFFRRWDLSKLSPKLSSFLCVSSNTNESSLECMLLKRILVVVIVVVGSRETPRRSP